MDNRQEEEEEEEEEEERLGLQWDIIGHTFPRLAASACSRVRCYYGCPLAVSTLQPICGIKTGRNELLKRAAVCVCCAHCSLCVCVWLDGMT